LVIPPCPQGGKDECQRVGTGIVELSEIPLMRDPCPIQSHIKVRRVTE